MDRQPKERDGDLKRSDDVEIQAPFGWRIRFPAKFLSAVVVAIAGVGALGYMIRDHDLRAAQQLQELAAERQVQLTKLTEQQEATKGTLDTVAYILLLNEGQRAQLHLDMPDAMRRKLLDQERPR